MPRGLDRQGLFAVVLLLAVLGLAGWLAFSGQGGSGGGQVRQLGGPQSDGTILQEQLDRQLQVETVGVMQRSSGRGQLPDGTRWSYRQEAPEAQVEVRDANGNPLEQVVGGAGDGGTLVLEAPAGTPLERELSQVLSDPQATLRGGRLQSATLVADQVRLQAGRLELGGLFLRSQCRNLQRSSGATALRRSCR